METAKDYLKKSSLQVLGLFRILQGRNSKQNTQNNAQESGKQHPVFLGQQKGDGLGRDPEKRNGPLEYEVPLYVPINFPEYPGKLNGSEKSSQSPAIFQNMYIGNFMECHHHRGIE